MEVRTALVENTGFEEKQTLVDLDSCFLKLSSSSIRYNNISFKEWK